MVTCNFCLEDAESIMGSHRACREHAQDPVWNERWKNYSVLKLNHRMFKAKAYQCPVCWKKYKKKGLPFQKHLNSHPETDWNKWVGEGSKTQFIKEEPK